MYKIMIVEDDEAIQKELDVLLRNQGYDVCIWNMKEDIVSFLEAEGAYTKEKKRIIYCIVSSNEIPKIKEIALNYDKKSFISVNDVNEVKGKGFKERYL